MDDSPLLERRNRELAILNSIARELNATINLQETLEKALSETLDLLDLRTGWIYLLDEESGEPELAAVRNLPPGLKENPEVMKGWCHCLKRFSRDELPSAVNVDILSCSRLGQIKEGKDGLKYHSSIPLFTRKGKKLGILNIATQSWHKLSEEELRILNTMADFISIAVERSRLFEELQRRKQLEIDTMKRELQIAHDMQMALLPERPPRLEGVELSGVCKPSREVGGDYYSYLQLDSRKLAIVISDVSGKGMQAATIAMRFNEMLLYESKEADQPVELLKKLDRSLLGRIPDEMFITAGIAVLDIRNRSLNIASAANPEIYLYSAGKEEVVGLEITGFPLGIFEEPEVEEPFKNREINLNPGDVVVFTSDGVEEARGSGGEFYG
ncbi:MAG: SpoIIE family protein phosphatase, partial [Candidatus Latescibacteria bacterium]|nr:SpoIIE family protein phosphatase [bacterium]MBD3423069.1 SpoIIE family protein phosphatase [Candidatus Latescibacterota bacterium]